VSSWMVWTIQVNRISAVASKRAVVEAVASQPFLLGTLQKTQGACEAMSSPKPDALAFEDASVS
jgi:hypothetical protein